MSINSIIEGALTSITPEIAMDIYKGGSATYIAYNYSTSGANFADDAPQHEIYFVQVHFFCPLKTNSIATRKSIKQKLFAADFTWPEVTDATDDTGQHWVFECELAMGAEL